MTTTARSNGLGLLAWATVVLAMLLMVVLSQTVERTPDERNYQMAGRALLERQGLHTIEQRFQGPLILLGTQLTDDRTQSVHDAACLRRARLGMLVFPLLLLVVLVRWTQQALGSPAACITALLAAVNPALLGYGPLLSSDVAFTATALLAAWSYWRWRNRAGLVRLLMLGAALGATMATKYTGALACAGLGLLVLSAPFGGFDAWPAKAAARRGLPARLGGALAALLVAGGFALLTLYAAYLFAASPFAAAATTLQSGLLQKVAALPGAATLLGLLPEPMVLGIDYQLRATGIGPDGSSNGTFFDRHGNHWAYYPMTVLCKTPPALLLPALCGALLLRRGSGARGLWPAVLLPPLLLLAYCSGTRALQMGLRYVLPVVPAMLMLAGAVLARPAWRRGVRIVVLTLVGATSLWDVAGCWPHTIGYFSPLCGGQTAGHRIVADGNLDWHQRQETGRRELAARHPELVFLHRNQGPCFGHVAVYTEDLKTVDPLDRKRVYHWLMRFQPFDRDGAAWLCYQVGPADFQRAVQGGDLRAADDHALACLHAGDVAAAEAALAAAPDGRRGAAGDILGIVAAVKAAGGDTAAKDAVAMQLFERGQLGLALAMIDREARRHALAVALMLLHTGRPTEAIAHFERVTADGSRTAMDVFQLAWVLCDGGPGYSPQPMRALELMQQGPAPAAGSPAAGPWQELLLRVQQAAERARRVGSGR